jgi:hypothetical protein
MSRWAECPLPPPAVTHINIIQNWLEELFNGAGGDLDGHLAHNGRVDLEIRQVSHDPVSL